MLTYTRNSSIAELINEQFSSLQFLCRVCKHSSHTGLFNLQSDAKLFQFHEISICSDCDARHLYVIPSTSSEISNQPITLTEVIIDHETDASASAEALISNAKAILGIPLKTYENFLRDKATIKAEATIAKDPHLRWHDLTSAEREAIIKEHIGIMKEEHLKMVAKYGWIGATSSLGLPFYF